MRHALQVVVPILAVLLVGGTTGEVKPINSNTPESDQSIGVGIRAFCEREYERASEILRPHAEQGNVDAQVILAFMLWDGVDVRQNRDEALSWFR